MKILVTGGAGFIGSHVVDRYMRDGHEVVVVDNLETGSLRNLHPDAKFVQLDIRDVGKIDALLAQEKFDMINHHAAQIDVRRSVKEPIYDANVNILGSVNLINAASRYGVGKFIYISTGGAIYGEPQRLPVEENDPVNPECPYGISKHTVEHYLYLYKLLYGLNYTVLRYPNVYGPRQSPDGEAGVIAIFAGQMLNGSIPKVYGDGKQLRDYVFVSDVAQANALALDRGNGEIINLGSEKGTSVLDLYAVLQRIIDFDRPPQFCDRRPGEIYKIYLTGKKAQRCLGWQPAVNVQDGLKLTVDWMRHLRGEGTWR